MKYMIMALTVMLAAMLFVLEVTKTQAMTVDIYEITCEDHQGNAIHSEYFAAGADLKSFEFPEAPVRNGYVFVGWSAELPETMPEANLVFVPIYMQQQLSLHIIV